MDTVVVDAVHSRPVTTSNKKDNTSLRQNDGVKDSYSISGMTRRTFVGLGAAWAGAMTQGTLLAQSNQVQRQAVGHESTGHKVKLSWRIGLDCYLTDGAFDQLITLLIKHPDVVDEVCLFESATVLVYLPPEWIAKTADVISRRFAAFRQAGVRSVGVDVLATLGHGDESWEIMPAMPLPPMIGHDGTRSRGCACPARVEFRHFIRAKYSTFARTTPDFILVDDDVRMQGHSFAGRGIDWGCFCDECLRVFGEEIGYSYRREELVAAFNVPENQAIRQAWIAHNGRVLESVYADVGSAVREVNPAIIMGAMTLGPSYTTYSNSTLDRWITALGATKARPGEGFYWDTSPGSGTGADRMEMVTKAFEISRQNAQYPTQINDRQAEYETFPYVSLLKNPQTAINERVLAIAAGCNGVAFNTLGSVGPFEEYNPLFQKVSEARQMLDELLAHSEGIPARGVWSAWSPHVMGRRTIRANESWLKTEEPYDMNLTTILAEIGIPLSAERCGLGTVLTGRIAETFDDEMLKSILAEGVLMDTLALRIIAERGFGEMTGIRLAASYNTTTYARLTNDPLNGVHAGTAHDVHQLIPEAFRTPDVLEPLSTEVRVLAQLVDYRQNLKGTCMTAYENKLGGRVVVVGYAPWWFIQSSNKRFQTIQAMDWIAKDQLPVRIEETCALAPFARINQEGTRGVVVLLNTELGSIETATVHLRLPGKTPVRLISTQKESHMDQFRVGNGVGVTVRNIPAWSTVSLTPGMTLFSSH